MSQRHGRMRGNTSADESKLFEHDNPKRAPSPALRAPSPEGRGDPRDGERWYRCAACSANITRHADAIEVAGRHVHARLNPWGALFAFGCFSAARCEVTGTPTTDATWFPPSAWQYAHCRCGVHLGWYFSGGFYGLVMERLVD